MAVKMDYKDDIFTGKRKYTQSANTDGTFSLNDVTSYQQIGDNFGAGDMNKLAAAINGFEVKTTTFNADGSITETDGSGYVKKTIFNDDGSIAEKLTNSESTLIATKTTTFNSDGSITETVS